jgi:hypothetical protein
VVDDIRAASPGDHWKQFEQSWTGLLTYRYLGKRTPVIDAGVDRETMPLRHDMRNGSGGILAAPLCIAAPEPYWLDDAVVPAPVVMSYEIVDAARDVRELEVLREVTHLGKTMGFSRARIVDASNHDRLVAVSSGAGMSLGVAPGAFEPVHNPPINIVDSPGLPPLHVAFGAVRGDDGKWRLPTIAAALASPHGALHLGPINIVMEAAAIDAVGDDRAQIQSWTVSMLRPGVVGPFRAEATAIAAAERLPVEVTLSDEGRDDRVIATAVAVDGYEADNGANKVDDEPHSRVAHRPLAARGDGSRRHARHLHRRRGARVPAVGRAFRGGGKLQRVASRVSGGARIRNTRAARPRRPLGRRKSHQLRRRARAANGQHSRVRG